MLAAVELLHHQTAFLPALWLHLKQAADTVLTVVDTAVEISCRQCTNKCGRCCCRRTLSARYGTAKLLKVLVYLSQCCHAA
jgi:hypothetical protein